MVTSLEQPGDASRTACTERYNFAARAERAGAPSPSLARDGQRGVVLHPAEHRRAVSTPAVAGGLVFAGSTDDNLYAIRA